MGLRQVPKTDTEQHLCNARCLAIDVLGVGAITGPVSPIM